MVDFIQGPGKILKYAKKVNFALLGPFFGLGPGKNYRLSPPLYGFEKDLKITVENESKNLSGIDFFWRFWE
jgi:hypothetical protein